MSETPESQAAQNSPTEPLRRLALIAFDEIALKRGQRGRFMQQLRTNIVAQLGCEAKRVVARHGRIEIELGDLGDLGANRRGAPGEVVERSEGDKGSPAVHAAHGPRADEQWRGWSASLRRVFGVKWYALAEAVPLNLQALESAVLRRARDAAAAGARTFKLEHSRRNKAFPVDSMALNRRVGALVLERLPELSVDVHSPDLLIDVEIRHNEITVFADKHPGAEGLPVGSTGAALTLLSGGIDSPVAAWYAMKRGLSMEYVHFHSPPYTGLKAEQKARDLVDALNRWVPQPGRLFLVPFARIQEEVADLVPAGYWTIIQRRFMQRIAGRIAEHYRLEALTVGDSIGQVASQTLSNMAAIDAATRHLVLRPLLGFDKDWIMRTAREIGTYEISIRPFEDCCVLFAPRKPAIRCDVATVEQYEQQLELDGLVEAALESMQVATVAGLQW